VLRRLLDLLAVLKARDRLRIFMHPQYLIAVRSGRDKIIHKKIVPCPPASGNDEDSWSPVLVVLPELLNEKDWRGAKPQLILSNHFVRYALIPWQGNLSSHDERQAFLRHNFQLAYGDAARDWDLRISDNGIHQAALASGVEQRLLMSLHSIFQNAGFETSQIYPHLMVAINKSLREITYDSYWFVMMEDDRLCAALIQKGHWRSVRSCACSADISWQISALIERESIICGIDTAGWPVVMYWPGHGGYQKIDVTGRVVKWIQESAAETTGLKTSDPTGQHYGTSHELSQYEPVLWA
jgi:hypothetical protein